MSTLFGNGNGTAPQPQGGGLSFKGIPMDRRPQKIPLGRGRYAIVKAGTRKTDTNFDQFYCVLKCVAHNEQPSHVGQIFEFSTVLQGLYIKNSLADIKKLLMYSFGPEVAKLDEAVVGGVLDAECLADQWKKFNESQSIEGRSIVGNEIQIFGAPGKTVKADGTPKLDKRTGKQLTPEQAFPRYYFDPADPVA